MIIDTKTLDYSFIHRRYNKNGDRAHPHMKQTAGTMDSDPRRIDTEHNGDAGGW